MDNTWRTLFLGTEQYKLCKRLKVHKGPLRTLNRMPYSHISAKVEVAGKELERTL